MKTKLTLLLAALLLCGLSTQAQINVTNGIAKITTNAVQVTALDNALNALDIGVTNYSVDPYATYAPSVPSGQAKFGGGILALYNFNQNASAGIGIDWLGQFSLVSGDLQLQAPFHLNSVLTFLKTGPTWAIWFGNLTVDPFVLGGVGTPYSGNGHFNGSAMVIGDVGGAIKFGHLWGGEFDSGVAWGKWVGNGPYGNVVRYHAFFGYTHGF